MKISISRVSMFYGANGSTKSASSILRKNMTLAELILWEKLKDRKIVSVKFRNSILYLFSLSTSIVMNITL